MVGHWLNSLMPWRRSGSTRMLTPWNFTPSSLSTSTTAAEKPHCGNTGVPFMNSSTSFLPISSRMRSNTWGSLISFSWGYAKGGAGLALNIGPSGRLRHGGQFEGMENAPHAPAQGAIDHLVLLHLGFAGKGRGNNRGGIMVTVADHILDFYLSPGNAFLDQADDVLGGHRHGVSLLGSAVHVIGKPGFVGLPQFAERHRQ